MIRADNILRNSNINFGVRAQTRLLNHCASSVNLLSRGLQFAIVRKGVSDGAVGGRTVGLIEIA